MARALRVVVAGGWYHVTARGNRRDALFFNDEDRRRFVGLVSELPERHQIEVHAYVLMDNHYHLLVRTPLANLSEAIRWLNVTYSVRFNWAHRQVGHVFQGRFKSLVIEDAAGVCEVARYVHLNPARVQGLGLGKADVAAARAIGREDPGEELVQRRLTVLADWPWSSWNMYSGREPAPKWLSMETVLGGVGGHTANEQFEALRRYTEEPLRQGRMESPWERLVGGLVLGSETFAQGVLKRGARQNRDEQTAARRLAAGRRPDLGEAIRAAERLLGRPWEAMLKAYGDWGRDGVLYVLVRHYGYRIRELEAVLPGVRYAAAAQGIQRFARELENDADRAQFVDRLRREVDQMSNI